MNHGHHDHHHGDHEHGHTHETREDVEQKAVDAETPECVDQRFAQGKLSNLYWNLAAT